MDSSSKLAVAVFGAFVAVIFVFLLAPSVTAALIESPVPATGLLVLVAVWAFPIVLIAGVIAYFAFRAIRR